MKIIKIILISFIILIAIILGFAISAPLEIRILESEINSELSQFQNQKIQELNKLSDSIHIQKKADLEKRKSEYENKFFIQNKFLRIDFNQFLRID